MIAYVEGLLVQKTPANVVIDIHGLGYLIHISLHTYEKIVNLERCRLLTHFVVKEDGQSLYGFFDEDERSLFRHLISISGVGPNTARTMLSSLNPSELRQAIVRGDINFLKSIKGIGPKSAQRIVIELQDVLKRNASPDDFVLPAGRNRTTEEALAALVALGFGKPQAEKAVGKVIKEAQTDLSVEEMIKAALKAI